MLCMVENLCQRVAVHLVMVPFLTVGILTYAVVEKLLYKEAAHLAATIRFMIRILIYVAPIRWFQKVVALLAVVRTVPYNSYTHVCCGSTISA